MTEDVGISVAIARWRVCVACAPTAAGRCEPAGMTRIGAVTFEVAEFDEDVRGGERRRREKQNGNSQQFFH